MGLPATGGFVASTRSPLTGLIAHSWAQGRWGGALRRTGYDMLVLQGQSADWCLLQIDGARVQLLPAGDLLGLDTVATARVLGERLGSEYSVLCIGPAGEAEQREGEENAAHCAILVDGVDVVDVVDLMDLMDLVDGELQCPPSPRRPQSPQSPQRTCLRPPNPIASRRRGCASPAL